MKKKVNVFGKSIPVLAIFVLGIALVSAALVPYLSGLVIGTVTVNQPLELTTDDETAVTWEVLPAVAFGPISQDFVLKNNAGTDVYTIVETNITGMDDTTQVAFSDGTTGTFGEEFETFWVGVDLSDGLVDESVTPTDLSLYCLTTEKGVEFDTDDNYCYWSALNPSTGSTFSGVKDGVFYVQIGDRENPTAIPAGTTMKARMKFQFKINVAPATYTFNTQALTNSSSTDLDGFK